MNEYIYSLNEINNKLNIYTTLFMDKPLYKLYI